MLTLASDVTSGVTYRRQVVVSAARLNQGVLNMCLCQEAVEGGLRARLRHHALGGLWVELLHVDLVQHASLMEAASSSCLRHEVDLLPLCVCDLVKAAC